MINLRKELFNIINNINLLKPVDKENMRYYIDQILCKDNTWGDVYYHIQKIEDNYFVYGLTKTDGCTKSKFITEKFITTDRELVIKLVIHYLIGKYSWEEVCSNYGGSYYVDYTNEVADFEKTITHKLVQSIPEKYREFDIDKECKFEKFIDSDMYKAWLTSK